MEITIAFAAVAQTALGDDENLLPTRFGGVAYSGDMVPAYGPFGDIAIDLASAKLPKKRLFGLVNHDPDQRAGSLSLGFVDNQVIVDGQFLDTPTGHLIASEFKQSAPWEFSVKAVGKAEKTDRSIEQIVNGKPMHLDFIIRNASFREVSFVPAGADHNTQAVAFSENYMSNLTPEGQESLALLGITEEQKGDTELTDTTDTETEFAAPKGKGIESQEDRIVNLMLSLSSVSKERDSVVVELEAAKQRIVSIEAELSAARIELATIATEKRKEKVRSLFSALNREWDDAKAAPYMNMEETSFSLMMNDWQEWFAMDNKTEPSLTTELAVTGSAAPSDPLENAVLQLRSSDPTMSQEKAVALALKAHPEFYSHS
jgi:hypothetical protein